MLKIFKSKNKKFADGDKIIFSGRGGVTYLSKENKYHFGWTWDDTIEPKDKDVDLIFDKNLDSKVLNRLIKYCNEFSFKYAIKEIV